MSCDRMSKLSTEGICLLLPTVEERKRREILILFRATDVNPILEEGWQEKGGNRSVAMAIPRAFCLNSVQFCPVSAVRRRHRVRLV
jgi:hypothetical protein